MITATSSEFGRLLDQDHDRHDPRHHAAQRVDRQAPLPAVAAHSRQCLTMPPWLSVKLTNTPTE